MKNSTPRKLITLHMLLVYGLAIRFSCVWIAMAVGMGAPIFFPIFGVFFLLMLMGQFVISMFVMRKSGRYIDKATDARQRQLKELERKLDDMPQDEYTQPEPDRQTYTRREEDYENMPPEKDPWDL